MIYDDYQIKGLEKLVNSSSIMEIYPMVEKITITRPDDQPFLSGNGKSRELWNIDIFLNDPKIVDEDTMYNNDMDALYLTDYHIVHLLPYMGFDQKTLPLMDVVVWGVDGNIVYSWSDWNKS